MVSCCALAEQARISYLSILHHTLARHTKKILRSLRTDEVVPLPSHLHLRGSRPRAAQPTICKIYARSGLAKSLTLRQYPSLTPVPSAQMVQVHRLGISPRTITRIFRDKRGGACGTRLPRDFTGVLIQAKKKTSQIPADIHREFVGQSGGGELLAYCIQ